jgi:HD-GYP domain-containing protein (c-di-GMP phosphodiesterase class II)
MQRYCRILAQAASLTPAFLSQLDETYIATLECCVPLHDIGKSTLPDHILIKSGKLDAEERLLMQTHTTVGAETLEAVAAQFPEAAGFLRMAIDIVRHHHERFDGTGYPQRLAGEAIPLSARIVTIADVYDALRARRAHKPALSHPAAVQLMTSESPGQFDPALLQVFSKCNGEFERVFRELPD